MCYTIWDHLHAHLTPAPHPLQILIKSQPSRVLHLGCQAAIRNRLPGRHVNGEFPANTTAALLTLEVPCASEAANWQKTGLQWEADCLQLASQLVSQSGVRGHGLERVGARIKRIIRHSVKQCDVYKNKWSALKDEQVTFRAYGTITIQDRRTFTAH